MRSLGSSLFKTAPIISPSGNFVGRSFSEWTPMSILKFSWASSISLVNKPLLPIVEIFLSKNLSPEVLKNFCSTLLKYFAPKKIFKDLRKILT